jgi:hypothetical protein
MGVVAMTIGGTDVLDYLQGGLSCDQYLNGRPNLRCRLVVRDGNSYRPELRDEVIITDDGTRVFGGIVFRVQETDVIDYKHRELTVECAGFEVFADVTVFNGATSAGTLKAALTTVSTSLSSHGISVDPAQTNGPALTDLAFPRLTVRQSLDQLAAASEWNWKFDNFKQVKMEDPGTVGAPFALDDTNSTILALDHTKTLADYANDVWFVFGDSSQQYLTDGWTGDGTTKVFPLHYPIAIKPGNLLENGAIEVIWTYGVDSGKRWYYRASDNSLVVDAAASAPINGHIITAEYTAQFPALYVAQDLTEIGLYDPWTVVVTDSSIFEWTQARYAAEGELARRHGVVRRLKAKTRSAGLEPGMTVNVTATKRGLSSVNFLIERVSIQHQTKTSAGTHLFFYEIEAVEGNQYQQNWIQFFRKWQGASATGGGAAASGTGSSGSTVVISKPYWGGSRIQGHLTNNAWEDLNENVPVRIDGGTGGAATVTVRVLQRTFDSGTSVQVRVVRSDTTAAMATGAASTSTGWDEELLTFTPDAGLHDYHLQIKASNLSADVYAIATTL